MVYSCQDKSTLLCRKMEIFLYLCFQKLEMLRYKVLVLLWLLKHTQDLVLRHTDLLGWGNSKKLAKTTESSSPLEPCMVDSFIAFSPDSSNLGFDICSINIFSSATVLQSGCKLQICQLNYPLLSEKESSSLHITAT